jgi:GTP-dependent dephospho-CoA kinase
MKTCSNLVLAGTFDHLHLGHKFFIKKACKRACFSFVGLTTGWANQDKVLGKNIQSFNVRLKSLHSFLQQENLLGKAQIFSLKNAYGPSLKNKFEVIAVTKDTLGGARKVNLKRREKGLKPLEIKLFSLVNAKDKKKISSTRIRLGEISRMGEVYAQGFKKKNLLLPSEKRYLFKKPLGRLLSGSQENLSWASIKALKNIKKISPPLVIGVGDITTQALLLNKVKVDLAVFDHRCQRQPLKVNLHRNLKIASKNHLKAENAPGTISALAVRGLQALLPQAVLADKPGILEITGEEDLLVLPLVLLSPLDALIYYGQPQKGLVQVRVTEKLKQKTVRLLQNFKLG